VVSLSPSVTEALFAMGAGDRVVGRSKQCDYPPEALALPVVGGFADPSLEVILSLSPTLVAGTRGPAGPELAEALRARGVDTCFPPTDTLDEICELHRELGRRIDEPEGAARVVATIRAAVDEVTRAAASLPVVRVALLFDVAPLVAAGPGGFPDALISLAHGRNVVDVGGAYPRLSAERLLALDPDVLIDGSGPHEGAGEADPALVWRDLPGLSELRAVKTGRVTALASSTALRPGPRIGQGLREMAKAIHGDAWDEGH
jgi:iron complex transport system substrate-binding protein